MSIGYACKTIGAIGTDMKSCTLVTATDSKLIDVISHNIMALDNTINYNLENNIKLFRISSDFIPFGSSAVNRVKWWLLFEDELRDIGKKIIGNKIRVSMHPGQYTVLNSLKGEVVERAIQDLRYHTRVLDSLGIDSSHKIVLHVGGGYEDKKASAQRFINNYKLLDDSIKKRLVIENDDKIYNIGEVLDIGLKMNIPVIYDNLHNEVNPSGECIDENSWIKMCGSTWGISDGSQKIHYSQQAKDKRKGSHSDFISIYSFMSFYNKLNKKDIDIMLEVKDKNLSCIKCINSTTEELEFKILEREWARYKYTILEKSERVYRSVENLFDRKKNLSPLMFYGEIEKGLEIVGDVESYSNALHHIWQDLKSKATEKERDTFLKNIQKYEQQQIGINIAKNYLRRIALKYNSEHILSSYYFYI